MVILRARSAEAAETISDSNYNFLKLVTSQANRISSNILKAITLRLYVLAKSRENNSLSLVRE